MATDLAEIEKAIYEQSFRTLDEQARVLDGVRTRAAALVGIGNVSTAFLGGLALMHRHEAAWPPVALFFLVVLLGLYVLLPTREPLLLYDPVQLLRAVGDEPLSLSQFRRDIATYNGRHVAETSRRLRTLYGCYTAATAALVAELMMWLWTLAR